MKISNELINYVTDADLHTTMEGINFSTNLREIVTIGYMIDEYEKAQTAVTVSA